MPFIPHASAVLCLVLIHTIFSFVKPLFFVFNSTQRFYSKGHSIKTYVSLFPKLFLSLSISLVFQSSLCSTLSVFIHFFSQFIPFQQLTSALILFFSIFIAYFLISFTVISINFLYNLLYFYTSLYFSHLSFLFILYIDFIIPIIFLHEYFSLTSISTWTTTWYLTEFAIFISINLNTLPFFYSILLFRLCIFPSLILNPNFLVDILLNCRFIFLCLGGFSYILWSPINFFIVLIKFYLFSFQFVLINFPSPLFGSRVLIGYS